MTPAELVATIVASLPADAFTARMALALFQKRHEEELATVADLAARVIALEQWKADAQR
jgi:hypothetical protein